MKIAGTWDEWDIILRALLKYRELLQKADSDGVVREEIVISDNWRKENTVKQLKEIYDEINFIKEDK